MAIMDILYDDYYKGVRNKEYTIYCIQCTTYNRALEFIEEMKEKGFNCVGGLPKDYHHVLVNLELNRVAGLHMPVRFAKNQIDMYEFEFEPVLEEHLKNRTESDGGLGV